ncbi:SRPBCC family protein [Phaeacidiphilus oryzae]|uniref:SRPBCC family protein n=1 Tax=Phaeacidiphilus oryzae TaxID=348818 RepID=UPI00068C3DFA|nr:SRPBCC family protein [Phaeacidiphilus oryzae]
MELDHSFTVPVARAEAWKVFQDLEGIAPCMPGAVLDGVDGDAFRGRVRVKAGAVQMSYRGEGTIAYDEGRWEVVLDLRGSEARGAGTAAARVVATLTEEGAGAAATRVRVRTSLELTGRPAQFGRGILSEIGDRLVGQFAGNLERRLAPATSAAASSAVSAAVSAAEPERLDLGAAVWPVLLRRIAVPVGSAVVAAGVTWAVCRVRCRR